MNNVIIVYKDGELKLEVNVRDNRESIWLNHQQIAELFDCDVKTINKHISNVLKEKLNKKVSIQRISPEGRQLDNQVASKIQRLHLSGVYLIKDTKRYYPGNNYLSHCLGFVGIDNQGLLGLELEYDSFLKGKNGSIDYYMDAKSHNLKMYPSHYTYSQSGMNITLTIDKRVQDVLERELSNAYDTYHPDGIWALAMNPKNGEIFRNRQLS